MPLTIGHCTVPSAAVVIYDMIQIQTGRNMHAIYRYHHRPKLQNIVLELKQQYEDVKTDIRIKHNENVKISSVNRWGFAGGDHIGPTFS